MPKNTKVDQQETPHRRNPVAAFFQNLFQSKAKGISINVEDLTSDDMVVAVMGPTGSGKSTFIELASGITGLAGHALASHTSKISVIRLLFPGLDLCFVDTPGFDDTNKSDHEIFKMISDWIIHTYKKQIHLAGLFYFHRISDNRIGGTCLKNMLFFENLCGQDYASIFLTTTMWNEIDEQEGASRERELKREYWRPMIKRGSSVKRFLYTRESAFQLLVPIFNKVNEKSARFLKTEMNDRGWQSAKSPTTGKSLKTELMNLLSHQQKILAGIQGNSKDLVGSGQVKVLIDEYHKISVELRRAVGEMRTLKLSAQEQTQTYEAGGSVGSSSNVGAGVKTQEVIGKRIEKEILQEGREGWWKSGEVKRSNGRNNRGAGRKRT